LPLLATDKLLVRSRTDLISLLILFFLFLLSATSVEKPKVLGSVVSKCIGMKLGKIVPQLNTHQLMELDAWIDVRISCCKSRCHFTQKSAATWCV